MNSREKESRGKPEHGEIQVFGCFTDGAEQNAAAEVLRSGWLGMGPKVAEFERQFAEHGRLEHFLMLDSGSNALYLALKLMDLTPGSEVILPSFTWVACAHAVLLAGCRPRFCDVDLDTGNVTRATVENCITSRTAAIMVVHLAGLPVDLEPILALGFPVIEDAAHAADSWHRGRLCGSIGDIGIYSFNSVKNIATGSGGGIAMKRKEHFERARSLRYSGIGKSGYESSQADQFPWWSYSMHEPFIKMLPSDLHAAVALAQLNKLDRLQARRKEIWDRYHDRLSALDWLKLPASAPSHSRHGYFSYLIRVPGRSRDQLAKYLLEQGIYTTVRYSPLHHFAFYGQPEAVLPNTETLFEDSLCLPLHPGLTHGQVDYIVETLENYR